MRALIQRVKKAQVTVEGEAVATIGHGLLVFLGVEQGDGKADHDYICKKLSRLRIFEDENGKMNLDVTAIDGEMLIVSQFTLCAMMHDGNRPSFTDAMAPDMAETMYLDVADCIRDMGVPVKTGIFGADMQVSLTNDGPVTLLLDSRKRI